MIEKRRIADIILKTREKNSLFIPETYAKEIMAHLGMPIPKQAIASTPDEAVILAKSIGFPIVLKVHSHDIIHKSDVEGVLVGLHSPDDVRDGFTTIVHNVVANCPSVKNVQVSVQRMVEQGTEIIIGMKRDEVFGPTILFGLGGVWVEILKDVSFRVSPLTPKDVDDMITEIKGYRLLGDYRGNKPRDLHSVKEIILQIERLAIEFPEIAEIDLNPVFLYENGKGAIIADARIILSAENPAKEELMT
jgi:acetate---CoA ligase (ADP-forming) subunit beta